MCFSNSDDVVFAPENLYFAWFYKLVLSVVYREMQDEEIVIVVNVNLRSLVFLSAVFDVKLVKVESAT